MNHYNLISTVTELPRLVGCHDFPNDQQGMNLIKIINDFINEQYRYTGGQVKEAFTMAVKRELYLDGKRVDPSTFGQYLSVNVVGQVLTAYKESKRDSNARPKGYNPLQLGEYKSLITPAESWGLISKWTMMDNEIPMIGPFLGAYNYLVEQGKIQAVKKVANRTFMSEIASPERQAVEKYLKQTILKQ